MNGGNTTMEIGNFIAEQNHLFKCSDALKGLATLTMLFKSGMLENEYWLKTPEQVHDDTIEVCQTIISSLNNIAEELTEVCRSIDDKEFKQKKENEKIKANRQMIHVVTPI